MNNIMITGATGFIGSHLIYELINNEYNVATAVSYTHLDVYKRQDLKNQKY